MVSTHTGYFLALGDTVYIACLLADGYFSGRIETIF